MSKKYKPKRKKKLSPEEQERRRIARERRIEAKKREQIRFRNEFTFSFTAIILVTAIFAVSVYSTVKYDNDALLYFVLSLISAVIFLTDRSGIRSLAFSKYPDTFAFADTLKSHDPKRNFLMELARTIGYCSAGFILFSLKPVFMWNIIWSVCVITGIFCMINEPKGSYSLRKDSEFGDTPVFLIITPMLVFSGFMNEAKLNRIMIIVPIAAALAVTAVFMFFTDIRQCRKSLILETALLAGLGSLGILLSLNCTLNFRPPDIKTVSVEDKEYISGSKSSRHVLYFTLNGESENIAVNKDIYDSVEIGGSVQISDYRGVFGIEYYRFKEHEQK